MEHGGIFSQVRWQSLDVRSQADKVLGLNIRVPKHELEAQQENLENAVKLPDGDYVGILAVYHQLHCLVHGQLYYSLSKLNSTDRN